jgi:hypothetical protein
MLSRIALAVALIGCSAAAAPPVAHPRIIADASPRAPLALGEIKLDLGRERVLLVHADGRVEADGRTALYVTEDGEVMAGPGAPILALQRDGSIRGRDGTVIARLHLDTSGTLTNAGRQIRIDANGLFTGIRAPGASVVGATDALLRRTALLVLIAATIDGSHSAPDDLATNTLALPPAGCAFGV